MPTHESNILNWPHGNAETVLIWPQLWSHHQARIHETSWLGQVCARQYNILGQRTNPNYPSWLLDSRMHPWSQIPAEQAVEDQSQQQHHSSQWNVCLRIAHTCAVQNGRPQTDYMQLYWLNSQTAIKVATCPALSQSTLPWLERTNCDNQSHQWYNPSLG